MARKILNIDNQLKEKYDEVLDKGIMKNERPYYVDFKYKGYNILVPLRTTCPRSYSVSIINKKRGSKAGLDFCKMLILTNEEMRDHTKSGYVTSESMTDIRAKRGMIISMMNKTINDYKNMIAKKEQGKDLSKDEVYLDRRSTLKNFKERL